VSLPHWTVDLGRLEAHSPEADVVFRWTDDDLPEVYLVRPRHDDMTEEEAWTVAQAAKRAIGKRRGADAAKPSPLDDPMPG
jgi:hypothetical protein